MVHDSHHGGLLRTRDGGEQRVMPLELFFDLVYDTLILPRRRG